MPSEEKVQRVAALRERIQGANALLLTDYRGLNVHDATELRRSLSGEARFAVVKNTLMKRAAEEAGIEELEALFDGPTAVAFVQGDVIATAKRVVEAGKRFPALVLKGGYMEGRVLSAAEAQALATLESREVMLSQIAGMLKAEMSRAASMFQALQSRFLGVLEAYKEKLPGEEAPAEAPAEEPQVAAPAEQAAVEEAPAEAAAAEEPGAEVPEEEAPAAEPEVQETSEAEASAESEEE